MMKAKKPKTSLARYANSIKPWRCVILAIDPGKVSGVAIYVKGGLIYSGSDHNTIMDKASRWKKKNWCNAAYLFASSPGDQIPLIVVIESFKYNKYSKWTADSFAGTAESVGVWKHYIEQLPKLKWKPKILRLPVDEWRKGIYGHCRSKAMLFDKKTRTLKPDSRDYWKRLACKTAGVEDDNEAEAILIGKYATQWWKVGEQAGVKTV